MKESQLPVLIELPYWPPVSWLATVAPCKTVCLEAAEHYQKGSYRNRCQLAGPNGLQRLSIPLAKGKHQQTPIREVRVANDEAWQQQHWRSIATAYGNAPFFEHYADPIRQFYRQKPLFLFDFNLQLLEWLLEKIGWEKRLVLQTEFLLPAPAGFDDRRNAIRPGNPAPPDRFAAAPYPQVFLERHGFLPDLSALDLLFCCGKNSGAIILDSLPEVPET